MAQTLSGLVPKGFPVFIQQPMFQLGDRIRWHPRPTADFGIITGLQYTPAPHLNTWAWKYTIWLDLDSPSHAWTTSDTAWEADLEKLPAHHPFATREDATP